MRSKTLCWVGVAVSSMVAFVTACSEDASLGSPAAGTTGGTAGTPGTGAAENAAGADDDGGATAASGGIGNDGGAAPGTGGVGNRGGAAPGTGGVGNRGGAAPGTGGVGNDGGAAPGTGGVGNDGGAAPGTGGVGNRGGAAPLTGGSTGNAGSDAGCEFLICDRAFECVETCDGPVVRANCCACEAPLLDREASCGTGGAAGATGAGGDPNTGGAGGGCSGAPNCNWCDGQTVTDTQGCITGYVCANGADPCTTAPCSDTGCATDQLCGSDELCWPSGAVTLTASYDGALAGRWFNGLDESIFLYGCGTFTYSQLLDTGWSYEQQFFYCSWEGVAVEVPAGQRYTETDSSYTLEAGTYRIQGSYGVGCTPGLGLSEAGCTALYDLQGNEVVVPE
jgi:hypothetical protein